MREKLRTGDAPGGELWEFDRLWLLGRGGTDLAPKSWMPACAGMTMVGPAQA